MQSLKNKVTAEFFGTALLLAIVTGSGIMGGGMSAGNAAVALLGNSIATGCGLFVLISLLGPISGAHFNPVVSVMAWRVGDLNSQSFVAYLVAQVTGAICGVWLTHLMFGLTIIQTSTHARHGLGIWASEAVSTFILLTVIHLSIKFAKDKISMLVALTVTAGYWFTSSTFFANPAVTIARSLTNTFVGIAPADIIGFVATQLLALAVFLLLFKNQK